MSNLLSNFVSKVQTKHWQNLQRRTQKLDVAERETLMEYLEDHLVTPSTATTGSGSYRDTVDDDHPGDNPTPQDESQKADDNDNSDDDDEFAEEDYELLQRDLDKANLRMEELQSKHDFLQTRLATYRSKIQAAEDALAAASEGLSPERMQAMKAKIDSYKMALQPVQDTYQSLTVELESHQTKIDSMQDRQLELKLKTQECQVVLQELCYGMEQAATTPTDQEILAQIVEKENHNENSPSSFQDEHASKDDDDDDVENIRTNGDDNEDDTHPEEDDIELVETANTTTGSLSIPAGTHAETN